MTGMFAVVKKVEHDHREPLPVPVPVRVRRQPFHQFGLLRLLRQDYLRDTTVAIRPRPAARRRARGARVVIRYPCDEFPETKDHVFDDDGETWCVPKGASPTDPGLISEAELDDHC